MMSKQDLEARTAGDKELVNRISKEFKVYVRFVYSSGSGSWFLTYENTIKIGTGSRSWSIKDAIVHEMAHALVKKEQLNTRPHGQGPHGDIFRETLLRIVKFCYQDVSDYGWEFEYVGIRKWATRKGYAKSRVAA